MIVRGEKEPALFPIDKAFEDHIGEHPRMREIFWVERRFVDVKHCACQLRVVLEVGIVPRHAVLERALERMAVPHRRHDKVGRALRRFEIPALMQRAIALGERT